MEERYVKPLEEYNTHTLKSFLDRARKCGGFWSPWDGNTGYSFSEIKAVLDTREHLPNKKERKVVRQAAAKRGR